MTADQADRPPASTTERTHQVPGVPEHPLPRKPPTRLFAAGLACAGLFLLPAPRARPQTKPGSAPAPGASNLPPTQPTAAPVAQAPPAVIRPQPRHAQVAYTQGLLSVSAEDSSLNQILRQISSETGMKITGGVADERVFGRYGPSPPFQVLSALLDGTGSNMLLLHRNSDTPAELVLSPRHGGPSPPPPTAAVFNELPEPTIESEDPRSEDPRSENSRYSKRNQDRTPLLQPGLNAPPASPATTAAPSTPAGEPQSPNGVKTPQQIYDQLERLRQQAPLPQ